MTNCLPIEQRLRLIKLETELEIESRLRGLSGGSLTFREYINEVAPHFKWYRHCEVFVNALQRVADGDIKRLMVFAPPRHGKSEIVSRLFPAYYLYRHPQKWAAIAAYAASLVYGFSRNVRDNYRMGGGVLKSDAAAVQHWETGKGGGLWVTGVGGSATGKGFDLGIIDDPVKDAQEADSDTVKMRGRDWLDSVWLTRMEPDAALVVTLTRWRSDDLAAYILSKSTANEEEEFEIEGWHILNFEAIKEEKPLEFPEGCTVEPDWREPGEALCPERYDIKSLKRKRKRLGFYVFSALYQQRPRPREGAPFKDASYYDNVPEGLKIEVGLDLAYTKSARANWTAAVIRGRKDGKTYILEVLRWQEDINATITRLQKIKERYNVNFLAEGNGPQKMGVDLLKAKGFRMQTHNPVADKYARALDFIEDWNAGNVLVPKNARWLDDYLNELYNFTGSGNETDDQVDASAIGYVQKKTFTFNIRKV